jgi:hypothetical protein
MNSVTIIPEQSFLQQQSIIMEARVAKEPPETPQRNILGTPRRTNTATGQPSIGGGIERMVGVTSVNLGGIEVDVEDVADRLRRLKVPTSKNEFDSRNEKRRHRVSRQHLVLKTFHFILRRKLIHLHQVCRLLLRMDDQ